MSGWNTIQEVRRIEEQVSKLGFKFGSPKHAGHWSDPGYQDMVSLVPGDECLPIYSRDAEIFTGTLAQVRTWLQGVQWARDYDMLHKISNDDKRMAAEQKERNRQLMRTLKEGKRVEGIKE
jgi:hypothetical protein